MDEHGLARYLHSLGEEDIHNELLRYKSSIKEQMIDICYRKWVVFGKKRRDAERKRLDRGWAKANDFINTKISEGSL